MKAASSDGVNNHSMKKHISRRGNNTPRVCKLKNLYSGRLINASSITEFCRKAGFVGSNSKYHITPVLDGKRMSYKGWFVPSTLDKPLALKDVFGNYYDTNIQEILRRKKLSSIAIKRLVNGRTFRGICSADKDTSHIIPPRAFKVDSYVFQDHTGEIFQGNTLQEVADCAGIHLQGAYNLVHGIQDQVKGVFLKCVKTHQRQSLSL